MFLAGFDTGYHCHIEDLEEHIGPELGYMRLDLGYIDCRHLDLDYIGYRHQHHYQQGNGEPPDSPGMVVVGMVEGKAQLVEHKHWEQVLHHPEVALAR